MSWLRGAAQGGPGEPSGSGGLTRATEQRPDERDRELGRRADALTLNVFAGLAGVPLVLGLFGAERFLADRVTVRCLPPHSAGERVDPHRAVQPELNLVTPKPKPTRVTNRIRELRAEAGDMSQSQLGALVGVTSQTIIAVEQGAYSPTLETAFRIAHALGRPLGEVFFFPMEDAWSTRPISKS
ncbi:hypothetical protein GCM10022399_27810 [Terrabacter ginsenosidimutans]|uniref:HTH cro/C1-type domain-containing protein n=1 Tax=Terrabacter ginsenosidimutans TaxID=490575 RepID=A0ABP7DUZ2_9MICO